MAQSYLWKSANSSSLTDPLNKVKKESAIVCQIFCFSGEIADFLERYFEEEGDFLEMISMSCRLCLDLYCINFWQKVYL